MKHIINRADIIGGLKSVKLAKQNPQNYQAGVGVSENFELIYEAYPKNDFSFVQDIFTYGVNLKNIKTRYIKVKATNINECPEYHPGSGGPSWIFSDEIIIN